MDEDSKKNNMNMYKVKLFEFVQNYLINPKSLFMFVINLTACIGVIATCFFTTYYFMPCQRIPIYGFIMYWIIITVAEVLVYGILMLIYERFKK